MRTCMCASANCSIRRSRDPEALDDDDLACRTQKDARRAAIIDSCRRKILRFLHLEPQAFVTWRAGRACALKMRDARIVQVWRACCLNLRCHRGPKYLRSREFQTERRGLFECAPSPARLRRLRGRVRSPVACRSRATAPCQLLNILVECGITTN